MEIPYGYCQCGCGNKTTVPLKSNKSTGRKRGIPARFIVGHGAKLQPKGSDAYRWRGGFRVTKEGRIMILLSEHPRADSEGYIFRYRLIAENTLGHYLAESAVVHHVDGLKSNDNNSNLVICENEAYHRLLHQRTRAYLACGHGSWRKCFICQKYDDPSSLYIPSKKGGGGVAHRECRRLKYLKNQTEAL